MQTFLPYEDFAQTAAALDYRRLGKQRVEAYQILQTLQTLRGLDQRSTEDGNKGLGWAKHPAVLMWKGHEPTLVRYALTMCAHWRYRGYTDRMYDRILDEFPFWKPRPPDDDPRPPPWLGFPTFHYTHRANLVRKNPEYYSEKFPDVDPDLAGRVPYMWPRGQG